MGCRLMRRFAGIRRYCVFVEERMVCFAGFLQVKDCENVVIVLHVLWQDDKIFFKDGKENVYYTGGKL